MAISPIAIATHGTLNSPLSVAAVRGHLTIEVDTGPGGGGGGASPLMLPGPLMRQLKREDDEILAIIAAFMEVMDE